MLRCERGSSSWRERLDGEESASTRSSRTSRTSGSQGKLSFSTGVKLRSDEASCAQVERRSAERELSLEAARLQGGPCARERERRAAALSLRECICRVLLARWTILRAVGETRRRLGTVV